MRRKFSLGDLPLSSRVRIQSADSAAWAHLSYFGYHLESGAAGFYIMRRDIGRSLVGDEPSPPAFAVEILSGVPA